ncbi:MAG: hypothetical protein RR329_01385 [Mucinivorans sp.]
MMKKLVLIATVLLVNMAVVAQTVENEVTKTRVKPRANLSLSYGALPINANNWWDNKFVKSQPSYGVMESKHAVLLSNTGVVAFSVGIEFSPLLELSLPFSWSHNRGYFDNPASQPDAMHPNRNPDFYEDWVCFTPNLKVNWFHRTNVRLYSRVGVGFGLVNRVDQQEVGMKSTFILSWQLSPIGVEFGRKLSGFVEVGYGNLGLVSAGIKLRLVQSAARAAANGKTQSKYVPWYDQIR